MHQVNNHQYINAFPSATLYHSQESYYSSSHQYICAFPSATLYHSQELYYSSSVYTNNQDISLRTTQQIAYSTHSSGANSVTMAIPIGCRQRCTTLPFQIELQLAPSNSDSIQRRAHEMELIVFLFNSAKMNI